MNPYIILIIIIVLIAIYHFNNKSVKENFEITDETENVIPPPKYNNKPEILNNILNDKFFTSCQFHKDYIDVINAFNDYDGLSPHDKQLFNINNIPVKIDKYIKGSKEINKVNQMVNEFIDEINEKIKENQEDTQHNTVHTWNNKYEQQYDDSFRKFRRSLGLPETLYNDEVKGTEIKLNKFFNVIKYQTEAEEKYIVHIIITRDMADDALLVKVAFYIDKTNPRNVIIENIDVVGCISNRVVTAEYKDVNEFYNFDYLNENNMVDTSNLMNELAYKHLIRQKLANEQIENLNEDDKLMHNSINPYEYQSYKNTKTIYNDVLGTKKFKM